MNTENVTITRKTRTLGWNYNTGVTNTDRGWQIDPPDTPYYKGTLRQVSAAISTSRDYAACKSGGTYYNAAWFVGSRRIVGIPDSPGPNGIEWALDELDRGNIDSLIVTVENNNTYSAASAMGSIKSDRKAETARENGRKGGRPKKSPAA